MPLKIMDLSGLDNVPPAYKHPYVMVRSDAHTVWRGHEVTQTLADLLVAVLSGHLKQAA
jgi:hypothetical protein